LLAQLGVRLLQVVGAKLRSAARADAVRRRAGHVDRRFEEPRPTTHRARPSLVRHRTTPDFLAERMRAQASATACAAFVGSSPRGLMLLMTSRSASVAPLAGR